MEDDDVGEEGSSHVVTASNNADSEAERREALGEGDFSCPKKLDGLLRLSLSLSLFLSLSLSLSHCARGEEGGGG